MGWMRLRAMLRYKHAFRLGFMTYMLMVLLLMAVWTSLDTKSLLALDKTVSHHPKHAHLNTNAVVHYLDDILVIKGTRNKRLESPVFEKKVYASNHSHPVKAIPPVADVVAPKKSLSPPCETVRKVEFFGQKLTLEGEPLCRWLHMSQVLADGRFVVYDSKMALLYDVTVEATLREKGPKGGEKMNEVWGQSETAEYIHFKHGFFSFPCQTVPPVTFGAKDHLNEWIAATRCQSPAPRNKSTARVHGLTLALQRYEYVNLYHTMTDFYNAFLSMLMFDQHPDDVTVLMVDAHPQGSLDDTWETLFGKVMRVGRLSVPTTFSSMAWVAMGYNSPLNEHSRPSVDYLDEFRHFFLSRHGVDGGRKANCSGLNWMFIWRRDYTAHPRNKGGSIKRKIYNEGEVLQTVREAAGPSDKVIGLQLDALPMRKQLQLIADTDVLLGMHGAGLSHTLFLPPHAGLIELYPTYWPQANRHFRSMANWRHLHYQTWQNHANENEKSNHRTYIPPSVVSKMSTDMRKNICG